MQKEFPVIKPSDLMRLIHYHENSMEETTPTIQLSPTRSLPQHAGITETTIQDKIWVGTQPNHINNCDHGAHLTFSSIFNLNIFYFWGDILLLFLYDMVWLCPHPNVILNCSSYNPMCCGRDPLGSDWFMGMVSLILFS